LLQASLFWLKSGIWVYPCHTAETFCISAWKAQAAGCFPVVTTYAGLDETVKSGVRIKGTAGDEQANNIISGSLLIKPGVPHPAKATLCLPSPQAGRGWGWGSFLMGNLADMI
jgi:hypothetical protein